MHEQAKIMAAGLLKMPYKALNFKKKGNKKPSFSLGNAPEKARSHDDSLPHGYAGNLRGNLREILDEFRRRKNDVWRFGTLGRHAVSFGSGVETGCGH